MPDVPPLTFFPALRRALAARAARLGSAPAEAIAALLCIALGAGTLAGWLFSIPSLLLVNQRWSPMVMSSALCITLAGIALLPATGPRLRRARLGAAALMLAIAGISFGEALLGIGSSLDLPRLHRALQPDVAFPGRMPMMSSVGFMLLAVALLLSERAPRFAVSRWLGHAVALLGLFGMVQNILHPEFLYDWIGTPVAMKAGLGLLACGVALAARLRREGGHEAVPESGPRQILAAASVALFAVALLVGLVTFSMLEIRMEQTVAAGLEQRLRDRQLLMLGLIDKGVDEMWLVSSSPTVATSLRLAAADPRDASAAQLQAMAQRLVQHGYQGAAFETARGPVAQAGTFISPQDGHGAAVALANREGFELVWQGGYRLRARLPLSDDKGVAGDFAAEQALPALDQAAEDLDHWGETGRFVLCWDEVVDLTCFPRARDGRVLHLSRQVDGLLRPVGRALRGETGTLIGVDAHGNRVLSAFRPLGESGLGMAVKIDLAELYAPLRTQFERFLVALAVIVVAGTAWLRRRLRPLAQALVDARQRAEQSEARFLSAVERAHHSFVLLDAVRDAEGRIADFRYSFVRGGQSTIGSHVIDRRVGMLLVERFPEALQNGSFERYCGVVETGVPETFEVYVGSLGPPGMWLEHRVAKHGDGVAVATLDITERVEARQRERERQALFRATVDSSLDMVLIMEAVRDGDGRITDLCLRHVNARGAAMLGRSEAELVDKRLCELLPSTRESGTFDKLVRVMESGEPLDEEMDVAEGSLGMSARWIHLQAVATGDRLAVTVSDITERRLNLERIQALAQRLALALRAGNIGTYEYDFASNTISADSFSLELLGFPEGTLITYDQWCGSVLPQDLDDVVAHIAVQTASGGVGNARYRIVHPKRGVRSLEVFFETLTDATGTPRRSVGVIQDVTERVLAEEQMRRQARSDPLTGLPNRTAFFERLELALARLARVPCPLAVLFVDVDHFKQTNDTHGHAAGDEVLREVARRLTGSVRGYDMVARIGGDEFTLVLEDVESLAAAQRLAAKMVAALQAPVEFGGRQIAIGLSIGGAYLDGPAVAAERLMETADAALYEIKKRGRNGSLVLPVDATHAASQVRTA